MPEIQVPKITMHTWSEDPIIRVYTEKELYGRVKNRKDVPPSRCIICETEETDKNRYDNCEKSYEISKELYFNLNSVELLKHLYYLVKDQSIPLNNIKNVAKVLDLLQKVDKFLTQIVNLRKFK